MRLNQPSTPYSKTYLDRLFALDESEILKFNKEVKTSLTPNNKNYDAAGQFNLSTYRIFTRPFDFSLDYYEFEKDVSIVNLSSFGLYGAFSSNIELSSDYFYKQSLQFQKRISRMLFGVSKGPFKLNIKTPIKSIFTNLDTKYEGVSNFEKTLFLAIYTRIKPLNMNEGIFINSVLKVMKPCTN